MEKAFAYICASEGASPRQLRLYCRQVFELGYVPICPKLSLPQFLNEEVAHEQQAMSELSGQFLRRCRMTVVCGKRITAAMRAEIGITERHHLICTTLDGLAKIKDGTDSDGY